MMNESPEQPLGDYTDDYQQGLNCEAQGYGIVAVSYYFKIVEVAINEMVDRATEIMLLGGNQFIDEIQQIQETKAAQARITLFKRIAPKTMPTNIKPLSALHVKLEESLYLQSDDKCLLLATKYRKELLPLVTEIVASRASEQKLMALMKTLRQNTGA